MLNQSSSNESELCRYDSEEGLLRKKYSRKTKTIKKKSHQMGMVGNKKQRCQLYDQGICPKGSMCSLSHSFIPDIAKKFCKLYAINQCKKGQFCSFSHNASRYPCKLFYITGKCIQFGICPFSHQQIDPDFYEEFLQENLEYISKMIEEDQQLTKVCAQFTHKINIQQKIKQQERIQKQNKMPFVFGVTLAKNLPTQKEQNPEIDSKKNMIKKNSSRKDLKSQRPFSIRLASKNRNPIPERIFKTNLIPKLQQIGEIQAQSGWQSKIEDHIICRNQCIELSPEQKWNKIGPSNLFQY